MPRLNWPASVFEPPVLELPSSPIVSRLASKAALSRSTSSGVRNSFTTRKPCRSNRYFSRSVMLLPVVAHVDALAAYQHSSGTVHTRELVDAVEAHRHTHPAPVRIVLPGA